MQNRTDRIVFKLFGKDPSDFPFVVRAQVFHRLQHTWFLFCCMFLDTLNVILLPFFFPKFSLNHLKLQILDWLSHSPTEIESYIRPGCIVLTIYLRLPESAWEEVMHVNQKPLMWSSCLSMITCLTCNVIALYSFLIIWAPVWVGFWMSLVVIASGQEDGFTLGCRTKLHLCVMVCSNLMSSTILNSFWNPKYYIS